MENGPFIDDLPITTVIFHSYVSLPEGITYILTGCDGIHTHIYIYNQQQYDED